MFINRAFVEKPLLSTFTDHAVNNPYYNKSFAKFANALRSPFSSVMCAYNG